MAESHPPEDAAAWRACCPNLDVVPLAGDQFAIVTEPGAAAIAARLRSP